MNYTNASQNPESDWTSLALIEPNRCNRLILGQKMLIASVFMYISLGLAANYLQFLWATIFFVFLLLFALVGMMTVIQGANFGKVTKNLLYLSIALPPFCLIGFVYLNNYATQNLRAAGYRVGIFGAKRSV